MNDKEGGALWDQVLMLGANDFQSGESKKQNCAQCDMVSLAGSLVLFHCTRTERNYAARNP